MAPRRNKTPLVPIKDNRAGLVRVFEETMFFFSFRKFGVTIRPEFDPLNNCWPFYVIKRLKEELIGGQQ